MLTCTELNQILDMMAHVQNRMNQEYDPRSLGLAYASPEDHAKIYEHHEDMEQLEKILDQLAEEDLQYVLALMWSGREHLNNWKKTTFSKYLESAKGESRDGMIMSIIGMNPVADIFREGIKANTDC